MQQRGRRLHIPVFGEWNQQQCEELPMTQYFESAMQAGLVRAGHCYHDATGGEVALYRSSSGSPPPQKPAKKVRSAMENHQQQVHAVSRRRQQGPSVADGGSRAPRRPRVVVVRSVDEDLYKVHPDLLPKKGKGRKHVRSLWMGCVGLKLNCVA
ncbi:hypothetical protein BAE44_0000600 [Dichanthelium oligosanthes]|uniref:Uncharacterized protein n=1 Tax=Dichanthelium oligosanthes TaxID=888268 RepID=A0A1E5WLT9_9POAL|nr:hypothetical protein BAE44_0000600 [Dichanthelium oligosanthes]